MGLIFGGKPLTVNQAIQVTAKSGGNVKGKVSDADRYAIAVSPGSGPQYGADAYIKAIMASDALAHRNRPDAECQRLIDLMTLDGGSVEDNKDDARNLLKDRRAKIAADMIAAGRPGPATRLLAQAAETPRPGWRGSARGAASIRRSPARWPTRPTGARRTRPILVFLGFPGIDGSGRRRAGTMSGRPAKPPRSPFSPAKHAPFAEIMVVWYNYCVLRPVAQLDRATDS